MSPSDRDADVALPDIGWRRLADEVPAAVFLHPLEPDRPPFYISPRIEAITGYRPDDLMTGRHDFLAPFVHPEDSAAMRPLGERSDRTLEPFVATYRLRRKDGRWIWLYNHTEVVRDAAGTPLYWQGFVIDVTDRKEAELALARSEARYRALVQRSTDATMIVQDGIGFTWISPAIRNIIGHEPSLPDDDLKARLVHPDDLAEVDRMAREVRAAPDAVSGCECRLAHVDGGWRWVEVVGVNHADNPAVSGIVYNVREITERKAAELAMARALDLQRQANEELVALGRDRAEFLAMLAHDLRTPLTAILGLSDLLRARNLRDPEAATFLETISANAGRLNRMVSEMLAAESLESRLGRIEREAASIDGLVRAAVASVEAAWPRRRIELDLEEGLPEVAVDPDAILRALANLLGNALKYSPDGAPVQVGTRLSGDLVEVRVIDRGVGIPADRLDQVFDRHVRVRSHATREIEGFGLGLPIVRAIARAHGGDVTAASVEGEGSTFVLWLPVLDSARRAGQPPAIPRAAAELPDAAPAAAVPCLADAAWDAVAPLLPPRPPRPKGGHPWADDRAILCGILAVEWGGATWASLSRVPGAPSHVTCWRRLRQWRESGVWETVLARLGELAGGSGQAALERVCPGAPPADVPAPAR